MIRNHILLTLALTSTGCIANMSKLNETSTDGALRRADCQAYVNDAASFVGQQTGFGIAASVLAIGAVGAGALVENKPDGNAWTENRKTIFLVSGPAIGLVAYNFFSNASSAASSASAASIALAEPDSQVMWIGCQRARAAYWDGRLAGISAASDAVSNAQQRPATPQAREDDANVKIADEAAARAKRAADTASRELDDAAKQKDPKARGSGAAAHYDTAKAAKEAAVSESTKAKDAVAKVKVAIADGDTSVVREARGEAETAADSAEAKRDEMRDALKEYLK